MASKRKRIKVIDLFSGVGGLTFGFVYKKKGNSFVKNHDFEFAFANDFSFAAASAFSNNYKQIKMFNCPVQEINESFIKDKNIDISDVDLIIGGPPCQSFSTIGKRRNDDRAKLYQEFQRLLGIIKPKMFLFENVRGILSFKTDEGLVIDKIENDFNKLGYTIYKKTLNAKDYGVPQNRMRVFIVGLRNDANLTWSFPEPISPNEISLLEAIDDMPPLTYGESSCDYLHLPDNPYQELMHNPDNILYDHTAGIYGERIRRIIESLDYGESHNDINTKVENHVLPNDLLLTSGYGNSYGRLLWDKPCPTITNNFGTPSAIRCIHPEQNRALTIREAARIQSFPDWFTFYGTISEKRKQIGNAVPPLLSISLANSIKKTLLGKEKSYER